MLQKKILTDRYDLLYSRFYLFINNIFLPISIFRHYWKNVWYKWQYLNVNLFYHIFKRNKRKVYYFLKVRIWNHKKIFKFIFVKGCFIEKRWKVSCVTHKNPSKKNDCNEKLERNPAAKYWNSCRAKQAQLNTMHS